MSISKEPIEQEVPVIDQTQDELDEAQLDKVSGGGGYGCPVCGPVCSCGN